MDTEIESLKQQFEILKTTFLPREKLEDSKITKNVDDWLEYINKIDIKNSLGKRNEYCFDYEIIKNAEAFALAPVFSYQEKGIVCTSSDYNNLNELKDFLKEKKYIVYCIHFRIVSEPLDAIETKDFTIIPKSNFCPFDGIEKNPKFRYTFRGHVLEEESNYTSKPISYDPMWQKPLSTSNPIPNTTSP